ncbi:hypothetical protein ACS0TY_029837 [Phlomoides rotata]
MELTHQHTSLLDELIMAPKIDTSFSNEFLQNSNWNFTQLEYQTPDLHFPITNPSFLELNYPNCPFGEFQPFLDALTSQDQLGSIYEKDDLPAMSIQEDGLMFLDNCINGFDVAADHATPNLDRTINAGQKKSKSKKPDGQPSKNLMAERRRRKRLNDRLSMLRSIVPKISKMDRTSILGDTIDYTRELLDKIHKLREEGMEEGNDQIALVGSSYLKDVVKNEMQLRNPPKVRTARTYYFYYYYYSIMI